MTEPHLRTDLEQTGVDGRRRSFRADPEPAGGAPDEQRFADGVGRREQQEPPRVRGKALQPPFEVGLEHPRPRRSEAGRQFRGAHAPRQLEQRQRVATGLRDQPLPEVVVEPAGDDRGEQGARIVVVEPLQAQLGQARQLALLTRLADGEDERDPLSEQAARHEPERLRGGLVDPLEVVHETQQRLRLGHLRQQRERCQADQEAVGSRAGGEAERDSQCLLLRLRKPAEPGSRPAELMQPGERKFHLRLDPGDLDGSEPWSLVRGEPQQRRLAHPCLAADDEHAARPSRAASTSRSSAWRSLERPRNAGAIWPQRYLRAGCR